MPMTFSKVTLPPLSAIWMSATRASRALPAPRTSAAPFPHLRATHAHLEESWTRQGFLEQFQGVVIIEDLDRVHDGQDLLGPRLRPLRPLLLLDLAVFVKVCEELFV